MSRIFEFLQKLNGGTVDSLTAETTAREDVEELGDAGQILSVLNLRNSASHPRQSEEHSELKQVRIAEVQIDPTTRLVVHTDPGSPATDQYRFLRMRLRELWNERNVRTLLVTSPLPQDGKSTVALNLATALAEGGKRKVLLIDADLHHSSLAERVGLPSQPGLAECLENGLNPLSAIRHLTALGWYLMPAGTQPANPTELLQTQSLSKVTQKLSPHFDWILVDSPPVIPLTDAVALTKETDGALLITRAGNTPSSAVEQALKLLGQKHVLGIVLNGVEDLNRIYSKYSAYYRKEASRTVTR